MPERGTRPSAADALVPAPGAPAGAAAAAASGTASRPAVSPAAATTAWLGAFLGRPGIAVIAGTGSVAVGGSSGALERVGGHGYLVGDEGSGYWMGKMALRAALAAAEGSGSPTRLGDALTEAAGASLDELVLRVQRSPRDRTVLTGLAPVVGRCAGQPDQDPVAVSIVAEAAAALAGLAGALRRRLGELPVAGVGGVFAMWPLWTAFQHATGAVPPLAPPEVGAALLAAGLDG